MKTVYYIICIAMIFFLCRCESIDFSEIHIDNDSEFTISFYCPLIGMTGSLYPDTTLTLDKKNIGYTINPGMLIHYNISNISYEKWISSFSNDTVSIFIFNKDILDNYSWEEIQLDYKILRRYDLSLEDLKKLSNEKGTPIIHYPPSEKMKDMKMYPHYGSK